MSVGDAFAPLIRKVFVRLWLTLLLPESATAGVTPTALFHLERVPDVQRNALDEFVFDDNAAVGPGSGERSGLRGHNDVFFDLAWAINCRCQRSNVSGVAIVAISLSVARPTRCARTANRRRPRP